jgi:hypothetical protein
LGSVDEGDDGGIAGENPDAGLGGGLRIEDLEGRFGVGGGREEDGDFGFVFDDCGDVDGVVEEELALVEGVHLAEGQDRATLGG